MKQHETLEERLHGSRVMLVAVALLFATSLVGYLMGVSDEHATAGGRFEPVAGPLAGPTTGEAQAAIPARTYAEMNARESGPNRAWPAPIAAQAGQPLPAPVYASQAALRELKSASLRKRAERRAYNGAPPVIPHPVSDRGAADCMACHGQGLSLGSMAAPKISHPPMTNCTQCHAAVSNPGPGWEEARTAIQGNAFEGIPAPLEGARAWPGAPPIMPHEVHMRTDCLSCHGPVGAPGMRTSHPERTNCQQCHAPPAGLPFDLLALSGMHAAGLDYLHKLGTGRVDLPANDGDRP